MIKLFVKAGLSGDRGGLDFIASPDFKRIRTAVGNIERTANVALRRLREEANSFISEIRRAPPAGWLVLVVMIPDSSYPKAGSCGRLGFQSLNQNPTPHSH
jgi:hypothetical protein